MSAMNCSHCARPLANALDTYGDVGAEVCAACWWAEADDGADLLERELLETIRLAEGELKFLSTLEEDFEPDEQDFSERHFFEQERDHAYHLLDEHRQRRADRLTRWRESVGAG